MDDWKKSVMSGSKRERHFSEKETRTQERGERKEIELYKEM